MPRALLRRDTSHSFGPQMSSGGLGAACEHCLSHNPPSPSSDFRETEQNATRCATHGAAAAAAGGTQSWAWCARACPGWLDQRRLAPPRPACALPRESSVRCITDGNVPGLHSSVCGWHRRVRARSIEPLIQFQSICIVDIHIFPVHYFKNKFRPNIRVQTLQRTN